MPKAFTEHEKRLIRKRLVEEGYRQFSAHGLTKTNIEELARAAHISKGAFYLFYESKEALFMDAMELAEERYREEVLAVLERPGASPRARLLAVFRTAFSLFKTIPILQFFTGSDYDLLLRRVPAGKLEEHLAGDRRFLAELIARCRQEGIPVRVQPEQIAGLLYPVVIAALHELDPDGNHLNGNIDLLLELIAAFCLGEVQPELSGRPGRAARTRRQT